jgi:aryl-alcohol dehydrogenase-like predicted oxidoreductase
MRSANLTHLQVSAICLGTMYFGSTVPEATSVGLLDAYAAAGGNFLDTANKYASWIPGCSGGESECMLGRWMRERGNRQDLVIATKLGLAMPGVEVGLRAPQIEAQCEASLRRLGIETIDLLYAHADDRSTPLEETLAAFERLRQVGKIRAIGASNYAAWRLAQACGAADTTGVPRFACVQVRHSLLRADPWLPQEFPVQVPATPELLDCCRAFDLPVLAYSPLLGGAYCRSDRLLPQSYRTHANTRRLEVAHRLARARGITINQVVLAWLRSADRPIIPVIAGSRLEHLTESLAAMNLNLEPAERSLLDDAALLQDPQP